MRTVTDRDGAVLRTRNQAQHYVLEQLGRPAPSRAWIHAAELLRDRAGAEAVTRQLELALLLDGRLDCRAAAAAQSAP